MNEAYEKMKNIALERTWVSFLHEDHPYSLFHWSISSIHEEQMDVWLLQDEVSFETREFHTIDEAIQWMIRNMYNITDMLEE